MEYLLFGITGNPIVAALSGLITTFALIRLLDPRTK